MTRNIINKIASSRGVLIAISCLTAIVLWFYVTTVENKEIEATFTGIPVVYIGEEDILADRKFIVTNKDDQTVSMTVYGKRSVIHSLRKEDINVSVDLTDIRTTGTVERVYDVAFANGVNESEIIIRKQEPSYISVSIDRISSREVEIRGEQNITVAEGYMAEPTEYIPEVIVVSGPEEVISQVDHAWVEVERENLSKTVTTSVDYILRDENNNKIESDEIEVSVEKIDVVIPVIMCKDVVLTVELIAGGGAKEENAVVKIEPSRVTLSGDAGILSDMNQISIGRIDLRDFQLTYTDTFAIPISNELNNLSGVTEATVTVSLKNLATKRIVVSQIEFSNVSAGYVATPVTQYVEVLVRGPEEIVELINAYNIRIVGDLTELGEAVGRYAVTTRVHIDGYSDAGVVGEYKVVVSLEEEGALVEGQAGDTNEKENTT